jgi:hypothetical protein
VENEREKINKKVKNLALSFFFEALFSLQDDRD